MDELLYERRGPLALITLNRPDRLNAITYGMRTGVMDMAREAEADEAVIAICFTGAGRGFCAGVEMDQLVKATAEGRGPVAPRADEPQEEIPGLFAGLQRIAKPVIAAVNGPAAGAGFSLAMMSDLRFVAEGAIMTTTYSRRGLIAEHGTSWVLPRLVGVSRALDLLWSSRRVSAEEALRIGLADRVCPADGLIDAVAAYVQDLAENVGPTSMAIIKSQVYRHLSESFPVAARETDQLVRESLTRPDAKEGAASFVERRPPKFARWKGWEALGG